MSNTRVSVNAARLEAATDSLRSLSIDTLTGHKTGAYAVDGRIPYVVARPSSPQGISEAMGTAAAHGMSVSPLGGATRTSLGNVPDSFDLAVDMTGAAQVLVHNASDLTATVEAGMRVSQFQQILAEHGQFLAIDPPLPERATIGGSLAVGWSGPATWQSWSPRDVTIGMKVVQADGTLTKSGGQVVKNVSGYDMARMHVGALGTLGIIAEVSFKLTPLPHRQATVFAAFESHQDCLVASLAVFGSSLLPLAIATLHGEAIQALPRRIAAERPSLAVRVGGRANTVQRQIDDILALCRRSNPSEATVIKAGDAEIVWRRIADFGWDEETIPVMGVRASVLPADIPSVLESVLDTSEALSLRCAVTTQTAQGNIGVFWYDAEDEPSIRHMRAAVSQTLQSVRGVRGTAVITHAPLRIKETLDVWGEPESAADVMRNLKRQYDPKRLLNPGRFVGGI